jgi:catalase
MAWRLPFFLLRHPGILRSVPANALSLARPPASYASLAYHAIHAFTWITPYGSERHVRYRWMPEERRSLSWLRAFWRGPRYLEAELRERLRRGAVRMHLQVQVARPGDPVADPSRPWPASRDIVTVGTMELLAIVEGAADTAFDPARLVDGIVATADPVLQLRHEAYAQAAAERRGQQAPASAEVSAGEAPPPALRH